MNYEVRIDPILKNIKGRCPPLKGILDLSVFKYAAWTMQLKKFLEDISSFCGAIDTPILNFW